LRMLTQKEFGALSYEVMKGVFAIRNELGRFFDERLYKQALARLRPDVELEVPVVISFRDFQKRYYLDVLVARGGLFEFKAVDAFTPRHRAQLMHYLLLTELRHGMLVNVRPERVEREFVNAALSRAERGRFSIEDNSWKPHLPSAETLKSILLELLADWGTGLELPLYEEALTHFLGGPPSVLARVPVTYRGLPLGEQGVRLASQGACFKLTSFESEAEVPPFETHAHRLLAHTGLKAFFWINLARHHVRFTTLA
jgi:GxxExxY protein